MGTNKMPIRTPRFVSLSVPHLSVLLISSNI